MCLLTTGFINASGKESVCKVGDIGSIPGLGRSPGGGHGYPLQYSGLENSRDTVHGVAKSRTQLSDFHFTSKESKQSTLSLGVSCYCVIADISWAFLWSVISSTFFYLRCLQMSVCPRLSKPFGKLKNQQNLLLLLEQP